MFWHQFLFLGRWAVINTSHEFTCRIYSQNVRTKEAKFRSWTRPVHNWRTWLLTSHLPRTRLVGKTTSWRLRARAPFLSLASTLCLRYEYLDPRSLLLEDNSLKNWKLIIYFIFMSFKTSKTFFLSWNTKEPFCNIYEVWAKKLNLSSCFCILFQLILLLHGKEQPVH